MRGELRGEARGESREAGELGRAAGCKPDDAEGLELPAESCAGRGEWPPKELPLVEGRARCCRKGRCSCLRAATATAALAAAAAACAAAAAAGPLAGGEPWRPECKGWDGADVISGSSEPGLRSRSDRSQGPGLSAAEGAVALEAFPGMTERLPAEAPLAALAAPPAGPWTLPQPGAGTLQLPAPAAKAALPEFVGLRTDGGGSSR